MDIGKRIAGLRKEKGLTQAALAKLLQVTDKAVSKWEQGVGVPDVYNIISLSEVLNVSTDYLLIGKDQGEKVENSKLHNTFIIGENEIISGFGFPAKTHAEFLNELLGKKYKRYMKCTYRFDNENVLWMIRLYGDVTKTGWKNWITEDELIIEEYVGDPEFRLNGHKIPPFNQTRYIFRVCDLQCDDKTRMYEFMGVYKFDASVGNNDYRVWKKISDSINLDKLYRG